MCIPYIVVTKEVNTMSYKRMIVATMIAGTAIGGYLCGRAHEIYQHRQDAIEITTTRPTHSPGFPQLFEISVKTGETTSRFNGVRLNEILCDMYRNGDDKREVRLETTTSELHKSTFQINRPTQLGDVPVTFGSTKIQVYASK